MTLSHQECFTYGKIETKKGSQPSVTALQTSFHDAEREKKNKQIATISWFCNFIVSQYVFYYPIYHFDCHEVVPERDPAGSLIIREQSPLLKCSCCVLGLAGQLEEPLVVLLWTLCRPSIAILLPYLGFYCHEIVTGNISFYPEVARKSITR